ncbi:hypothetical protein [Tardiphaga sp. 11_C7_N12_6]|uniref:hypothetical protein n=1 Tax=Tardiphaga sp. 11_C7_N12_6 TaxID=3240789 RepID=UPI003F25FEA0
MSNDFTFRNVMIENADGPDLSLHGTDHTVRKSADVEVFFRNLTERLIEQIEQADVVFGCVAWLTSLPVLDALALKKAVGIVVQKEDFLRPDSGDWRQKRQRDAYARLPGFTRYGLSQTSSYSFASDPSSEAVRCVGAHNAGKASAFSRMHNKFLVFCMMDAASAHHFESYKPYAAWTGSFNLTYNATNSLENAVLIRDVAIANSFAAEFGLIFGLSERLDWGTPWAAPEYRIGT